jgi:hypothetical protein
VGYLVFGFVGVRRQEKQHRRISAIEAADEPAATSA